MELKIIQTGEWDGEPITRRETVAEAFARELESAEEHDSTPSAGDELPPEVINELTERD
jgi:hypothetical protein